MNIIELNNVSISAGKKIIVHDVSVDVKANDFVAIIGPSGAGKSTLLNAIAGTTKLKSGSILFNGRVIDDYSPAELALQRAVLPQQSQLTFGFTVIEVVLMGRTPGWFITHQAGHYDAAYRALKSAGIEHLGDRSYSTLSGGERQRVHFARVLAQLNIDTDTPRVLLLDEPTSQLDIAHAWNILSTAKSLTHRGATVVCVLHDINLAARFADSIAILKDGNLYIHGLPGDVLSASTIRHIFGIDVDIMTRPDAAFPIISVSDIQTIQHPYQSIQ